MNPLTRQKTSQKWNTKPEQLVHNFLSPTQSCKLQISWNRVEALDIKSISILHLLSLISLKDIREVPFFENKNSRVFSKIPCLFFLLQDIWFVPYQALNKILHTINPDNPQIKDQFGMLFFQKVGRGYTAILTDLRNVMNTGCQRLSLTNVLKINHHDSLGVSTSSCPLNFLNLTNKNKDKFTAIYKRRATLIHWNDMSQRHLYGRFE